MLAALTTSLKAAPPRIPTDKDCAAAAAAHTSNKVKGFRIS
jgi:hypothetical protein